MTFRCALCHNSDVPKSKKKRALCEDCYASLEARNLAWCSKGHRVRASDMALCKAWCRACDAARNRKYVEANQRRNKGRKRAPVVRPHNPEQRRRYYLKHRDKELARAKRRYYANPEAQKARMRVWAESNKAYRRVYRREQYIQEKLRKFRALAPKSGAPMERAKGG